MSTTIGDKPRRQLGIDMVSRESAKEICDAIIAATDAVAAADQFLTVPIADLTAGGGVNEANLFEFDFPVTVMGVKLIALGSFAGVDASNTIVVTVKDADGHTVVAKTYNNVTVPTDSGGNPLGTLDSTHKNLLAGEELTITIVCGTTADPPALLVQVRYRVTG